LACLLATAIAPAAMATSHATQPSGVDTFERSVNNGWGSGPLGSWSYERTAGAAFSLSVDGHRAVASAPSGVNKGNLLVGQSISGPANALATFSTNYEPASGTPNHFQIVLRHQASQTYYAIQLFPNGSSPAEITIFEAKSGVFTEFDDEFLPFAVTANHSYVIEGAVDDSNGSVRLYGRAWPAGTTRPSAWEATGTDSAGNRLQSGTAGVRLSMYAGPVTDTVDDYTLTVGSTSSQPPPSPSPSPSPTTSPSPSPSPSPSASPPPPGTTIDSFTRTLTGSWGSGSIGTWSLEVTAGSAYGLRVDGQKGIATANTGDKGNLVVGPSTTGAVDVRSSFTESLEPSSGSPNHWMVLARHQGVRTYYAADLSPNGSSPADLDLFMAKNGVFTDLLDVNLPFVASVGQTYVVEVSVSDVSGGVSISAKAWPAGTTAPSSWQVTASDTASDRLTSGNVGVRFGSAVGPVTFTADDFTVTR
jgi:hypothetical protein